jgi:anti-repressor protein
MNEIQVFENAEFGKVRTVMLDGEPYFVGRDVARVLGYSDGNKAIAMHVDNEDKKLNDKTSSSFGQRGAHLINESGMYSLILSSKLPSAKKFKHWVTSEILPAIRKTGRYQISTMEEQVIQGLFAAQKLLEAKDKEINTLKPKADFYDAVADSESLFNMAQVAKTLDMDMGRNNLFKKLREWGILDEFNHPYQQYVDAGYFKLVENYYMVDENSIVSGTTYVKQRGLDFIRKKIIANGGDARRNYNKKNSRSKKKEDYSDIIKLGCKTLGEMSYKIRGRKLW